MNDGAILIAGGGKAQPQPAFAGPLAAPASARDYSGIIARGLGKDAAAMRASLIGARALPPDAHLQAVRMNVEHGVPIAASLDAMRFVPKGQAFLVDNPYGEVIERHPRLVRWLSDPVNAGVSQGDMKALIRLDDAMVPLRSSGFFGSLGDATQIGLQQLRAGASHLGAAYGLSSPEEAAQAVAAAHRELLELQGRKPLWALRFDQDLDDGDWLELLTNVPGMARFVTEQLPNALPPLVTSYAGAKAGAGFGTVINPGAGTVALGLAGAASGAFAGAVPVEVGAWIDQALAARGVDLTEPAQILKAYRDQRFMEVVRAQAERKGLGTAGVDALFSLFAAGHVARAAAAGRTGLAGVGTKIIAAGADVARESVGEGVSEAAGQLLATGEVDPREVAAEMLGGFGQSVGQVAIGATVRAPDTALRLRAQAAQARSDAKAIAQIDDAWTAIKAAKEVPERVAQLVDAAAEGGPVQQVLIDREAWDAAYRGTGVPPAVALGRVLGDDASRIYSTSDQTGAIALPIRAFVAKLAGGPDLQRLLPSIRVRADGMTLAEAEQALGALQAQLRDEIEAATKEREEEQRASGDVDRLAGELERARAAAPTAEASAGRAGRLAELAASLPGADRLTVEQLRTVATGVERVAGTLADTPEAPAVEVLVQGALQQLGIDPQAVDSAALAKHVSAGLSLAPAFRELADLRDQDTAGEQASQRATELEAQHGEASRKLKALRAPPAQPDATALALIASTAEQLRAAGWDEQLAQGRAIEHVRLLSIEAERRGVPLQDLVVQFPAAFTGPRPAGSPAPLESRRSGVRRRSAKQLEEDRQFIEELGAAVPIGPEGTGTADTGASAAAFKPSPMAVAAVAEALAGGRRPAPNALQRALGVGYVDAVQLADGQADEIRAEFARRGVTLPELATPAPGSSSPVGPEGLPSPPAEPAPPPQPGAAALPEIEAVRGRETHVFTVGGSYDAHFALVELTDLIPSHRVEDVAGGRRFVHDERYPDSLQPRDYSDSADEQGKVERIAQELPQKAELMLGDTATATDGPPIITPQGIVLNGNGRTMGLQLGARLGRSQSYEQLLTGQLERYGLPADAAAGMKHPALVRVVDVDPDSRAAHVFAREGNEALTQAQPLQARMAALKEVLPESALQLEVPEDTTLPEVLAGDSAAARRTLQDIWRGLPPNLRPAFFTEAGVLNQQGREAISRLLLSAVFSDDTIGLQRDAIRALLVKAIPPMAAMQRELPAEVNLSAALDAALRFGAETLDNWTQPVEQQFLGRANPYDELPPLQQRLVAFLLDNWRRDTSLRNLLAAYVTYAKGSTVLGQAHVTAEEALSTALREVAGRKAVAAETRLTPAEAAAVARADGAVYVAGDDREPDRLLADPGHRPGLGAPGLERGVAQGRGDQPVREGGEGGSGPELAGGEEGLRVQAGGQLFLRFPSGDDARVEQGQARGGTSPADDEVLAKLVSGAGGELKPGARVSTLLAGVVRGDLSAVAVLQGATVRSPRDAASLLAAWRSPFVERVTFLLVGPDGRVKHNGLWSIGTIDQAMLPGEQNLAELLDAMGAKPGDSMVWAHNHPSGNPTPSNEDRVGYSRLRVSLERRGIGFQGLVLNGDRFAHDVGLRLDPHRFDTYDAGSFRKSVNSPVLDSARALASWAKSVTVAPGTVLAVHADSQLRIVGVEAFTGQPTGPATQASRQRVGGAVTFLVGYDQALDPRRVRDRRVEDLVELNTKTGLYYSAAVMNRWARAAPPLPPAPVRILREGEVLAEGGERYDAGAGAGAGLSREALTAPSALTFLQSASHYWLEAMADLASSPAAPPALREEFSAVLAFLDADTAAAIGPDEHRAWSHGFFSYLTAANPDAGARRAFAPFGEWLLRVYQDSQRAGLEISPAVREVLDRLTEADESVAAAEAEGGGTALFAMRPEFMTEEEWEKYQRDVAAARARAREIAARRRLEDVSDARHAGLAERLDQLRSRLWEQARQGPELRSYMALAFGLSMDGTPLPNLEHGFKVATASLKEEGIAPRQIARLRSLGVLAEDEHGLAAQTVADAFGFTSAEALVEGVITGSRLEEHVNAEAIRQLAAERPDLAGDAGKARQVGREALSNPARAEVVRTELGVLRRMWRAQQRAEQREAGAEALAGLPSHEQVRDEARKILSESRLREIDPKACLAAARRHSDRAVAALAAGRAQAAATAKSREALNHELYRQGKAMLERQEQLVAFARGLAKPGSQMALGQAGPSYRDQVNAILSRFEFAEVPLREIDRRQKLGDWIAKRHEEGLEVLLSEQTLDEALRTHYRNLTLRQLQDVVEDLKQIEHVARTKNRLSDRANRRQADDAAGELVAAIRASRKKREQGLGGDTKKDRATAFLDGIYAGHMKASLLARIMDGGKDGGPVVRFFIRPVNDAASREALRVQEEAQAFLKLYEDHFSKDELRAFDKRTTVAGVSLSKEDVLTIAGQWGNDTGRSRVRAPKNGLTETQIREILATLTERDWKFVQARWDWLHHFWPEIAAKQERVYGVRPEAVEPRAFTIRTADGKTVALRGGYMPIGYDDTRAFGQNLAQMASSAMAGAFTSATTRRGFTVKRMAVVDRRLRLDRGVVLEHLRDVVHDLTHHEMLMDVNRLLRHRDVVEAIEEHYGKPVLLELQDWIQDIAAGDVGATKTFERAVGYLRRGTVAARLAFRLVTALKQLYGLRNTIVRIGPKWTWRGVTRMFRDSDALLHTPQWVMDQSEFMRSRARTFQREVNEMRNSLTRTKYQAAKDMAFWMVSRMQLLTDTVTWLGAYEKAMSEAPAGSSPEAAHLEAAARADQTVRDTQGGGQMGDLAAVERGGPLLRILTTFYTDGSLKFGLTAESIARTKWKDPLSFGRFLSDMLLMYWAVPVIGFAVAEAAAGDDGDEAERKKRLFRAGLAELLDPMIVAREFVGPVQGYDYRGPAGLGALQALMGAGTQLNQGEIDENLWKSLNMAGGSLLYYPAQQLNESASGFAAWMRGEASPAAVVFGPPARR